MLKTFDDVLKKKIHMYGKNIHISFEPKANVYQYRSMVYHVRKILIKFGS